MNAIRKIEPSVNELIQAIGNKCGVESLDIIQGKYREPIEDIVTGALNSGNSVEFYKDFFIDLGLRGLGFLEYAINTGEEQARINAISILSFIDHPNRNSFLLNALLKDPEERVRVEAAGSLASLGLIGLEALQSCLSNIDTEIRLITVAGIGQKLFYTENPDLEKYLIPLLFESLNDEDSKVRAEVYSLLIRLDRITKDQLIESISDDYIVRNSVIDALWIRENIGGIDREYYFLIVRMLEDQLSSISIKAQKLIELLCLDSSKLEEIPFDVIDELVIRENNRNSDLFNPNLVSETLLSVSENALTLRDRILKGLCDLSFSNDGAIRKRSISVARRIDRSYFIELVNAKGIDDKETALTILLELDTNLIVPSTISNQSRLPTSFREMVVSPFFQGLAAFAGLITALASDNLWVRIPAIIVLAILLFTLRKSIKYIFINFSVWFSWKLIFVLIVGIFIGVAISPLIQSAYIFGISILTPGMVILDTEPPNGGELNNVYSSVYINFSEKIPSHFRSNRFFKVEIDPYIPLEMTWIYYYDISDCCRTLSFSSTKYFPNSVYPQFEPNQTYKLMISSLLLPEPFTVEFHTPPE